MTVWFSSLFMFLGRISLGAFFIWSAFNKVINYSMYHQIFEGQVVMHASFFLITAIAIEFFGGLALMFGWWTRIGAAVLLIYMIPATAALHNFWNVGDFNEKHIQTVMFMKNLGLSGGLFYILACGPGRFCYEGTRKKKDEPIS